MQRIKVIVKPNSKKNELFYDEESKQYRINIKAKPENNKANIELIKFLSKRFGKVKIVSGLTSKKKVIEIEKVYK
jgi:uncharacterized protein